MSEAGVQRLVRSVYGIVSQREPSAAELRECLCELERDVHAALEAYCARLQARLLLQRSNERQQHSERAAQIRAQAAQRREEQVEAAERQAQHEAELQGWIRCCEEERLRADWALEERLADAQVSPRCGFCGVPGCLYCDYYGSRAGF